MNSQSHIRLLGLICSIVLSVPYPVTAQSRWTFAAPESILTTNFKIHYTLSGTHATTQEWADSVALYAERAREAYLDMGWSPEPPSDINHGGDNRYDIYIFDVLTARSAKGMVWPDAANPPGSLHYSSWMEITKDSIAEPFPKYPRLCKLIAHELHHAFQQGWRKYDFTGSETQQLMTWVENTSVYMEDVLYPQFSTLQYRLSTDDRDPLSAPSAPWVDGDFKYSGGLWAKFLAEKYGAGIIHSIWDAFKDHLDHDLIWAFDHALSGYGGLTDALKHYALWRYCTGARATSGYFSDASNYPTSAVEAVGSAYPYSCTVFNNPESQGGCAYVQLNAGSPGLQFTVTPSSDSPARPYSVFLVGELQTGGEVVLRQYDRMTPSTVTDTVSWNVRKFYKNVALIAVHTSLGIGTANLALHVQASKMASINVTYRHSNGGASLGGSMLVGGLDTVQTDQSTAYLSSVVLPVKTLSERFTSGDTVRKQHNWLSNSTKYKLTDVFTTSDGWLQFANYSQLRSASLCASLIESGGGAAQLGIRDPWYLHSNGTQPDSFFTYSTPFSPTGAYNQQSGGVFLNQDPNQTSVFYSVRAAETQTVNGQAWVFWKWDTSGVTLTSPSYLVSGYYESPAIFRNWGSRTVTAQYKAHLASNASDVMTAGGQRRLVVGDGSYPNIDHMLVYGSAGSIWASYKTSSGAWGNEVCISGSGSNHATPSASWGGTYLPVVWRSGSSGNYIVLFNKRSSGSWLAGPVTVASGVSSDPAPQIAFRTLSGSMTRRPHVAYRTSSTGLTMRWSTDDGSSWSNSSSFTDNDGIGAYSLSAVNTLDDYDAILTLAYVSNMLAYVRDFQGSWGSRVLVPASVGENYVGGGFEPMMTDTQYPQVVRHYFSDRTVVAFDLYQEYFDGDWQWLTKYYRVVQTRDEQGEWGTATAFEASWPGTPSLSLVNGKFTMLWEDAGTLTTSQESQGAWAQPSSTGSGAEPALAVSSGTSTSSAHYAWRENASGLYKIVPSSSQMSRTVGPQQTAKQTSQGWVYRRVITMIDTVTGGIFSVTASLPSVAGRLVPLTAVNDTLPGINAMNFFSLMEPAPFTAEFGDSLTYELTFATSKWPKDAGAVSVQAGLEADRLTQSVAERSIDLTRRSLPLRLKMPLEASSGSPVRLALEGSLPEWADRCVFTLTHVYAKPTTSEPVVEATPATVMEKNQGEALSVYPNPFNPETRVGYWMKEGGEVKVSVCDLLGREVAVLVDGWMPAGTHSAIWNARDFPSGTYICRLVAQESGKSVVRTAKMQYVR